jgi:ACR3 family arsenite efflux pump ArsB
VCDSAAAETCLIEVPVMLLVVRVVNRSKGWYEAGRVSA